MSKQPSTNRATKTRAKTKTKKNRRNNSNTTRDNNEVVLSPNGKRMGRPPGSTDDRLSPLKQEEVFAAWIETDSFAEAGRLTGVDPRTVARYHDKYQWERRRERIHQRLADDVEEDIAKRQADMIRELAVIRSRSFMAFLRGDPKTLKPKDAAAIHDRALVKELELAGRASEDGDSIVARAAARRKAGKAGAGQATIPEGLEVVLGEGGQEAETETAGTDDSSPREAAVGGE